MRLPVPPPLLPDPIHRPAARELEPLHGHRARRFHDSGPGRHVGRQNAGRIGNGTGGVGNGFTFKHLGVLVETVVVVARGLAVRLVVVEVVVNIRNGRSSGGWLVVINSMTAVMTVVINMTAVMTMAVVIRMTAVMTMNTVMSMTTCLRRVVLWSQRSTVVVLGIIGGCSVPIAAVRCNITGTWNEPVLGNLKYFFVCYFFTVLKPFFFLYIYCYFVNASDQKNKSNISKCRHRDNILYEYYISSFISIYIFMTMLIIF